MKEQFKRIRVARTTLLIMLLCSVMCTGIFAAQDPDAMPGLPNQDYSLKVTLQSTNPDGSKTGIKNAKLNIYKAANLRVKNTAAYYTLTADFRESGVDFDGMTADGANEAAKKFASIVKEKSLSGVSGVTDGSGGVLFKNLEEGIYLVLLDKYDSADERYTEMAPFIVSVPGIQKGDDANSWICDFTVFPKIAVEPRDYIDVDPPLHKKVINNRFSKEKFVFELKAGNVNNPMPVGSKDGKKRTVIRGAGKGEFGGWRYTEPGTYTYYVREVKGSNGNYKYDTTEYRLTDKVYYSGSKLKVKTELTDEKGKGYSALEGLVFTNEYISPIPPVITGDNANLLLWIICLVAALGSIAFVAHRRCR